MNEIIPTKVLLIEDDPNDAELFRNIVRSEDDQIKIQWTDRLESALKMLADGTFDIVITDLDLPDSKGIETFLRIYNRFPFMPVVVLSGLTDQAIAMSAVKKGAQDYLVKGRAKGDSILRVIRYSIERQRLLYVCDKQLKEIKTLKGLIPICAWCRKIHTDKGYWEKVETYIEKNTDASFSHGICPACLAKTEPRIFEQMQKNEPKLFEAGLEDLSGQQGRIRVLLIEDDPGDRELVVAYAKDIRLAITSVDRLSHAVDMIQRENFDLIVSDLRLPDSHGIETFIKINKLVPDIPIVLLTGNDDKELAVAAVRSGAQDYVVKGEINTNLLQKAVLYAIERHKNRNELRNSLREIKKLQGERQNILSMFAHDIKNSVIPAAWLISRMLSGKERIPDSDIEQIRDGLVTAEQLLEEFIEFARFESGEYKPVLEPFDIESAIRKQVDVSKIKAAEKKIGIAYNFSERPFPILMADGPKLKRVIANLIDNAVKYTSNGGFVNVSVQKLETAVLVQVEDIGIGIAEAHIPHIFDAFYRVPGAEKGSGLGLAIAKMIVNAHRGEIWVESTAEKGSTFSFTIPL